jgi:hypothetical protein
MLVKEISTLQLSKKQKFSLSYLIFSLSRSCFEVKRIPPLPKKAPLSCISFVSPLSKTVDDLNLGRLSAMGS